MRRFVYLRYNPSSTVSEVDTTYSGVAKQSVDYLYYPDGSRRQMDARPTTAAVFGSGSYVNTAYNYDGDGRMTGAENGFGEVTAFGYQANSLLNDQAACAGSGSNAPLVYNEGMSFRPDNSRNDMIYQSATGQLMSRSSAFDYNGAGQITSVARQACFMGTEYDAFSYDSAGDLIADSATGGGIGPPSHTYAFDYPAASPPTVGNPTTFQSTSGITYNAANQRIPNETYDADGNPITYGAIGAIGYDCLDRPVSFGTNGSTLTVGYLPDGTRAWKKNPTTTTYFVYDGSVPIAEINGNGMATAVNTWGPSGLISRNTNPSAGTPASVFYTFDERGNTAVRLEYIGSGESSAASGQVWAPFGQQEYLTPSPAQGQPSVVATDPYAGMGAQYGDYTDRETGLVFCQNRYYDPSYGRWLTRDPIGTAYSAESEQ